MKCINWTARIVIALATATAVVAQTGNVSVELVKGTVRGYGIKGLPVSGAARVAARITNNSGRPLTGVTIRAYYAMFGLITSEPKEKEWNYHKFQFKPPIASNGSTTVQFVDKRGEQNVYLEVTKTEFEPYIPTVWFRGNELPSIIDNERLYVGARDLADAFDGSITAGDKKWQYILLIGGERTTISSSLQEDDSQIKALELGDKYYIPLAATCERFGITIACDSALQKYDIYIPLPGSANAAPSDKPVSNTIPEPKWMSDDITSGLFTLGKKDIHLRGRLIHIENDKGCTILVLWARRASSGWEKVTPDRKKLVQLSEGTAYLSSEGKPSSESALQKAVYLEIIGPNEGEGQPIEATWVIIH